MRTAPIPILTYHQVDAAPPKGARYRGLVVTPGAFARQMRWLSLLGYTGVSMSALEPYLRGEKQGRVVGITFDDGYANNLEHAAPVLACHGFSATCYMVSGQAGGSNVWDHGKGIAAKPLMNRDQLRAWVRAGQEIGGHTRHHVDLRTLHENAARDEIAGCRSELEDMTGAAVRHFCYPYGFHDPVHARIAREAGYATAVTTQRSRVQPGDDAFELPRVPVLLQTTLAALWMKLATGYEDRRRR